MSMPLPVAVIGAGPVGLAAAAHLLAAGQEPVILEAGSVAGAHVAEWGHVRLFSPWSFNVDPVSAQLLRRHGWVDPPADEHPTGGELVDRYLEPLAVTPEIAGRLRTSTRVLAVTRAGYDRMKTPGRDKAPFVLRLQTSFGEEDLLAEAVIDASGTWSRPNPLGAAGIPALGEAAVADRITYGIPDVLGSARSRYAGKRVLVVGSGHSAFNAIVDLVALAAEAPGTEVTWAVRRPSLGQVFGGGERDALAERGRLGDRVRALVESGPVRLVTGVRIDRLARSETGVVVSSEGAVVAEVDEIIGATGFRPDLSIVSELRVALDPALESPSVLAPLIDPNVHSCGTVPPHGAVELAHPETGFYIVGMKAYGRAPTALMRTGYEQVRSVVAALTGDWEAARRVELTLPETGVCSLTPPPATGVDGGTAAVVAPAASGCCG
jgi:thioredoxin reductase